MWTMQGYELMQRLPQVRGRYTAHFPLSKVTWFQVGGPAEVLFKPADVQDLIFFMQEKPADIPVNIIGVGSNLLVRDGGVPGVTIRLGRGFTNIAVYNEGQTPYIDVGAAVLDRTVAFVAKDEGVGGLEFLVGVPGTMGGAVKMNAGCYGGDMASILESVLIVDKSGLRRISADALGLSYRHSALPEGALVVGMRLKGVRADSEEIGKRLEELLAQRESTQPIRSRTGGSTFANPETTRAWELIDQAGCRGLQIGGAQVSPMHCNFLINTGSATATDLETLGEEVRARVRATSGIELRWEIQRWGHEAHAVLPEETGAKAA